MAHPAVRYPPAPLPFHLPPHPPHSYECACTHACTASEGGSRPAAQRSARGGGSGPALPATSAWPFLTQMGGGREKSPSDWMVRQAW